VLNLVLQGPIQEFRVENTLRSRSVVDNTPQHSSTRNTTSMARSHERVLQEILESQNGRELSIIKLSEPVGGSVQQNAGERTSDVSAEGLENPTPASLEADLAHYKVCSTPL
jgi:hypothetical protein